MAKESKGRPRFAEQTKHSSVDDGLNHPCDEAALDVFRRWLDSSRLLNDLCNKRVKTAAGLVIKTKKRPAHKRPAAQASELIEA